MSYDLTAWHDPRLRNFDRAMARLERSAAARPRDLARLHAVVEALVTGPLGPGAWSVDPSVDVQRATLGLCLTASGMAHGLGPILVVLRAHGLACWDPQEAVVYYVNGRDSRAEKAPDGVHEGVPICLAELRQSPPLPVQEQLDALEALMQFALADSPDEPAAVRLALPVLLDLLDSPLEPVRQRAAITATDLCRELRDRGKPLELEASMLARVAATPLSARS